MARRRRYIDAEIVEPGSEMAPLPPAQLPPATAGQRMVIVVPVEPIAPLRKNGAADNLKAEALGEQLLGEVVQALRRAIRRL